MLLSEKDLNALKERFSKTLTKQVKLLAYLNESESSNILKELLAEVQSTSDKISVHILDEANAKDYNIEFAPAIIPANADGYEFGARFYGLPAGHEFGTFIQTIEMVGSDNEIVVDPLSFSIEQATKLSVFVTPTCPYCPRVALMAIKLALVIPAVTTEIILANEFEELSNEFRVSSVPHTVINKNKDVFLIGAYNEKQFIEWVVSKHK